MRLKILLSSFLFFAFIVHNIPNLIVANAACRAISCNAIFATDRNLNSTISSINQKVSLDGTSACELDVSTVYVGYEIECDSPSDRITMPHCLNYTCDDIGVSNTDLATSLLSKGGSTYLVGQVPSARLSQVARSSGSSGGGISRSWKLETTLWSGSDLCGNSSIPVYLTDKPYDTTGTACADVTDDDPTTYNLCDQIPEGTDQRTKCDDCQALVGVWTAVGCIQTNAGNIVQKVISIGMGIGGGIALLLFMVAGWMLSTSSGDPKKTSDAKELLTSSIIGLLFIIFSVTILQFIGVTLFQIPGFGVS